MSKKVLGIDLGSHSTRAVCSHKNQFSTVTQAQGIPSMALIRSANRRVVGARAAAVQVGNPETIIPSIPRLLGQRFSEWNGGAEIVQGEQDELWVSGFYDENEALKPTDLAADLLKQVQRQAASQEPCPVVLAVPTDAGDRVRRAFQKAAEQSGLETLSLINQTTAAAVAAKAAHKRRKYLLVLDWGAASLRCSLIQLRSKKTGEIIVKASASDSHCAGDKVFERLTEELEQRFEEQLGKSLVKTYSFRQELKNVSQRALAELDSACFSRVRIYGLKTTAGWCDGDVLLRRELLRNNVLAPFLTKAALLARRVLKESGVKKAGLLLIGQLTRSPLVREHFSKVYELLEIPGVSPENIVAHGAAQHGQDLLQGRGGVSEVLTQSIGIRCTHRGVPDVFSVILKRNTRLPVRNDDVYTTVQDYQETMDIDIYQGDEHYCKNNTKIGHFVLKNLQRARRGVPSVRVTQSVDSNGLLTVSARDQRTHSEHSVTIRHAL